MLSVFKMVSALTMCNMLCGRSNDLGEHRKERNQKMDQGLRKRLKGPLPTDVVELFRKLSKALPDPVNAVGKVGIQKFSRMLKDFEGDLSQTAALVVPGQHIKLSCVRCEEDVPKVLSCDSELETMRSKTLPKRLILRGSDGREYWWLVKGGEDLRQDERLQQLFATINHILKTDVKCVARHLLLETYSVIPVSKRVGLLEWVQDTKPLQKLCPNLDENFKSQFQRLHPQPNNNSWHGYKKCLKEGGGRVGEELDKKFQDLVHEVGQKKGNVMKRLLLEQQASPQAQFLMRKNFATSLAAMNSSHYVLGIGDRHNGNTLVSSRGQVIGIDFGVAFGKGVWGLPVPELVPFRLTQQMLGVLAPLDSEALLKRSMTCAMSALRANKHLLQQNLSIFLDDPTMDWIIDSKGRQGSSGTSEEQQHAAAGAGGSSKKRSRSGQPLAGQGSDDEVGNKVVFLQRRMDVLESKLEGTHPCDVMLEEIGENKWEHVKGAKEGIHAILDRARGGKGLSGSSSNAEADSQSSKLPVDDQVEALVKLATHPATLSRIWIGWESWK